MFVYARESQAAQAIVEKLLGPKGVFADASYLTRREGASLFLALTEANPRAALRLLQRTVGTWKDAELAEFSDGRQEVNWALERIAVWKQLFPEAAELLLRLAESEPAPHAVNHARTLVQLFAVGPEVALTQASPSERFVILDAALKSRNPVRRTIALDDCNQALETMYFFRMVGPEFQGLRPPIPLWRPKSQEEIMEAYRQIWRLLRSYLQSLENKEREQAVKILLGRSRQLARIPQLTTEVLDTLEAVVDAALADTRDVISATADILSSGVNRLSSEQIEAWRLFEERLVGADFSSLMRRYIGMSLMEDRYDENMNEVDHAGSHIMELVETALEHPDLLIQELDWLLGGEAPNAHRFGYELGKRDHALVLSSILMERLRSLLVRNSPTNALLLGGYFRAIREISVELWEGQLDALATDVWLRLLVAETTWRSGMTNRAILRVLSLARNGHIPVSQIRYFTAGAVIGGISVSPLEELIDFLIDREERIGPLIGLELASHYSDKKSAVTHLGAARAFRLLTHEAFFKPSESASDPMLDYYWNELAMSLLEREPQLGLKVSAIVFEHFGEHGTIAGALPLQPSDFLIRVFDRFPEEVWEIVTKYLGPPIDARAFSLREWLRGGFRDDAGIRPIEKVPLHDLWKWVDADVDRRSWYLAGIVPNLLFRKPDRPCLAREVLLRYGDRKDVQSNLMANFETGGWWGPASAHYEAKKKDLSDYLKDEEAPKVRNWIMLYIEALDEMIKRERIAEERDEF